jgi:ELWxxDGT repeat protein
MTGNRGSATGRVRGRCSSQTLPCPRPGAQILAHGCVMGDTLTSLLTMASTGVSFGGAKSPACPRRGSVRARRARWQNPIPGPRARCSRASCPSRPDRLRWAQGGSGGSARPARLRVEPLVHRWQCPRSRRTLRSGRLEQSDAVPADRDLGCRARLRGSLLSALLSNARLWALRAAGRARAAHFGYELESLPESESDDPRWSALDWSHASHRRSNASLREGHLARRSRTQGRAADGAGAHGLWAWVFARGLDRDAQPGLLAQRRFCDAVAADRCIRGRGAASGANRLWMAVRVNGASQLWVGDGQPGQFVSIGNIAVLCDFAGELGDKLIYAPSCSSPGPLFAADPQTRTVERIHPSAEPTRGLLALGARRMLFVASDAQHGSELWITDGTQAGTRLFLETMPGPESAQPELLGQVAGLAYGALDYSSYGREPFVLRYGAGQSDAGRSCGTGGSILFADDPCSARP